MLTPMRPRSLLRVQLDVLLQPVARIKIKDWVSFKAFPSPQVKVNRTFPVFKTGMAMKLLYECPLNAQVKEFWRPPARLMIRSAIYCSLPAQSTYQMFSRIVSKIIAAVIIIDNCHLFEVW